MYCTYVLKLYVWFNILKLYLFMYFGVLLAQKIIYYCLQL